MMGVNCAYLIDALAHCPGDTVEIALNSPAEPLVVRSPGSDQWRCVVMPIHLGGSMRFRKK
jgi:DNA polymerase III sliding clamp (beta) subunit (PCNA family)